MAQRTAAPAAGAKGKFTAVYAEPAIRLVMGFLLANARITGGISPFGAAFAGASPGGLSGTAAVLGAAAGYLAGGEMMRAVKYIAVIVIIRSVFYIMRGTGVAEKPLFPLVTALAAALGVGFVYIYDGGWDLVAAAYCVVESFLTAACVFFFSVALSPWEQFSEGSRGVLSHSVSSAALLAALLVSAAPVSLFGVMSVGRALAIIAVLLVAYKGGVGTGCAFGAAMGGAMDLAAGTAGVFTAAYALAAVTAGLFAKSGRLLFVLAYTAMNAIVTIWTWPQVPSPGALYETFAASVIFLLLPAALIARASALFPVHTTGYGFLRARAYTRERLEHIASALRELAPPKGLPADDTAENPAVLFDRASAAVCADCPDMARCWQEGYADTLDIMNNLTPRLRKYGRIEAGDLPARFADKCLRLGKLVGEINAGERALRLRREYLTRLLDFRRAVWGQYAGTASLLSGLSEELGGGVSVDAALERRLSKYLAGLNIAASAAVYRVKGGRLRAEISGGDTAALRRDDDWLEKLSEVMGARLCTYDEPAGSGRLVLLEAEPIRITVGTAAMRKNGARISGDKALSFRTDEGLFYIILSDGMGSGEAAHALSDGAVRALEGFIRGGVTPEVALGFLETAMFLRSDTETESATVDLMSIDMFTGETRIYKYGAAPSYLKKDSIVKRITGSALPAGLMTPSDRHPGAVKLKLPRGAFAVMVSDGVISGTDDKWLRSLICGYEGDDPKELSREILERARLEAGTGDDMTVLAIRADVRE